MSCKDVREKHSGIGELNGGKPSDVVVMVKTEVGERKFAIACICSRLDYITCTHLS